MPWTFSHPAAILPLRRFCPRWMNLAALVIGALTPDLGYYLGLRDLGIYAHSFAGSLFVCIPAGLAMFACFYLFRKPLCHLLPEPHRSALSPLTQSPLPLTAGAFIATIPSIAAGTWSHIVWDAFTHQSGWVVARYPLLQQPALQLGPIHLAAYQVLQHLSSLLGLAALIGAYWLWLRSRGVATMFAFAREDVWRYVCLIGLSMASVAIALSLAGARTAKIDGYRAFETLTFKAAIYGGASFVVLLLMVAVASYAMRAKA